MKGIGLGRDEDFGEFVAARWPGLVRSAVLLGCDRGEAEDVAQTALTRCLVHWDKVDRADDQDAYVHKVLVNTFMSARRRRWLRERPVADLPEQTTPDAFAAVDLADAVLRALRRLPTDQRIAVVLRYYLHLTEVQM